MHKFKNRFRLRFNSENETGGSGGEDTPTPPASSGSEGDLGFPTDTPVKDMTPEQQAAYWKDKARKHERESKKVPRNLDELIDKAQKFDQQQDDNKSPDEKALDVARAEGKKEGVSVLLHDAVRAQLQALRPNLTADALDDFLEDVTLDKYIGDDGRLDTDRVNRLAGMLSGAQNPGDDNSPDPDPNPGASALGDVLRRTTQPPKGNAGSVDDYRQREAERYAQASTK